MGRKKQPIDKTLFDSMGQCAASLGVSMDALKAAKRMGCRAFRAGGRVDGEAFKQWLKENPQAFEEGEGKGTLKDQKIREEIRKLRIANDAKERALVSRARVIEAIDRTQASIDTLTESKLVNEWPHEVAGLDVNKAREYGRKLKDEMMGEIRKMAEYWNF
jgi:hypothetical protein